MLKLFNPKSLYLRSAALAFLFGAALFPGAAGATWVPIMMGGTVIFVQTAGSAVSQPPTSVTYTYDVLGRVTSETYANNTVITYTYDSAGNITNKSVTCGSGGC